ncbi:MAG: T9SS type A sorting domain-containing protein [Bacteroidales bacterium]|nr:T9SS type A sorting domain-containing protein [Bacteroidales bacterium]
MLNKFFYTIVLVSMVNINLRAQCVANNYEYKGLVNFSSNSQSIIATQHTTLKPAWAFYAAENVTYNIDCGGLFNYSSITLYDETITAIAFEQNSMFGGVTLNWTCSQAGIYYFMISTNTCNPLVSDETVNYYTTEEGDNFWLGHTGNWNDTNNWSTKNVPTQLQNIYIGAADNACTLTDSSICKNIYIDNNGTLNEANQVLEVYGNWTNYGTHNSNSGTVIFKGNTNSFITRLGNETEVLNETFESGASLWSLGSIAEHTAWQVQNDPLNAGNHDCALYDLYHDSGHSYYTGGGNIYVTLSTTIDLSLYESASFQFDWRNDADGESNTIAVFNGEVLDADFDNDNTWNTSGPYNIDAHCGIPGNFVYFRAWAGPQTEDGNNPGLCIDNVIINAIPNVEEFYHLFFEKEGAEITLNSSLKIYGNISITQGALNISSKNVECKGNFSNVANITTTNGSVVSFTGAQNQTFYTNNDITLSYFRKNSNYSLSFDGNASVTISDAFSWTDQNDSIIIGNTATTELKINSGLTINEGCTVNLDNGSTLNVAQNFRNLGSFSSNDNNTTLSFYESNNSYVLTNPGDTIYSEDFESDPFAVSSDWVFADAFGGRSEFRWSNGAQYTGIHDLAVWDDLNGGYQYDYMWDDPADWCTASIDIDLSPYNGAFLEFFWRCGGADSINSTQFGDYGQVLINGTAITERLWNEQDYIRHEPISLADYCGQTITLTFKFVQDGMFSENGGEAASPGLCIDNLIIFANSTDTLNCKSFKVDKTELENSVNLACPINVEKDMKIDKGILDAGGNNIRIINDWATENEGSFIGRQDTVFFIGNQNADINIGLSAFDNLYLNKQNDTLYIRNNSLNIDGSIHIGSGSILNSVDQNILLHGNWNNDGFFMAQNNTITFDGTSTLYGIGSENGHRFYNVILDGQSATQTDSIIIEGNFAINSGTWDVGVSNSPILLYGDFSCNGTLTERHSELVLLGNNNSFAMGSDAQLYNLTINKNNSSNYISLLSDVHIANNANFISGGIFLNNRSIYLDETGFLSNESDNNRAYDDSGQGKIIASNRYLSAGSNENIAGIGLSISPTIDMQSTQITRVHLPQDINGAGNYGIYRYYDITPTINTGLDASLEFSFFTSELNGLAENNLKLFRSEDTGNTWEVKNGVIDNINHICTLNNIDAFSRWTLAQDLSTLPIELINFDVECITDGVELKWKTASETNNAFFTIEKSYDNILFENCAEIIGAFNSNTIINYQYNDLTKGHQTRYYRLKQTDIDFHSSFSESIPITCPDRKDSNIKIWYSNHQLIMYWNRQVYKEEITITITDMLGKEHFRKIFYQNNTDSQIEPILDLSPGAYFIELSQSNKNIYNQKIIVQ